MTSAELETIYEALAERLDATEAARREIYLAKLVLLLAQDLGDAARVRSRIAEAALNLDA